MQLTPSGKAVAQAADEMVTYFKSRRGRALDPQHVIWELATSRRRDSDPYRAAMMTLLESGVLRRLPGWKVGME
jgi:hypothetical protein